MSDQIHEFDIEKIGYKKIRELQKYVRAKLNEIENSKFCDQMSEKKDEIDLDEMESEWTEEFIDWWGNIVVFNFYYIFYLPSDDADLSFLPSF